MALASWIRMVRTSALVAALGALLAAGIAFAEGARAHGPGLLSHQGTRGILCAGFLLLCGIACADRRAAS
jgi:hypothetical protein